MIDQETEWLRYSAATGAVVAYGWMGIEQGTGIIVLDATTGTVLRAEPIGKPKEKCGVSVPCDLTPAGDALVVVFGDGQLAAAPLGTFVANRFMREGDSGLLVTIPCPDFALSTPRKSKERRRKASEVIVRVLRHLAAPLQVRRDSTSKRPGTGADPRRIPPAYAFKYRATQLPMSQSIPDPIDDISDAVKLNFVGFASFTILVWDHIVTFDDEVEYIWKGKKGPIAYLFLFNRYLTPLGFIVNLFAYLSPSWTVEGCTVAIAIEVVGLMMLLRMNALYPTRRWIPALLGVLLAVETGIYAWLFSEGESALHNRASACSMGFAPAVSGAARAAAWYPLVYDSIIFGLTVNRTLPSIRKRQAGFIVKKLLEDGLLYYSVIFSMTLVLTIMLVGAPPRNKNICVQMEQVITVAMMSRITLSLKKAGHRARGEVNRASSLSEGRNPTFFSDSFMRSVGDAEDVPPPPDAHLHALHSKQPGERIILPGRMPIQFAVPPSPQPPEMFEMIELSARNLPGKSPLQGDV
ncbi:hypothetical protein B0H17DRAFT_1217024 [Mycena rosella]|uniref:DUF6533 domain-containing protein n=1 Tax=Mycena rosella TaxID=1033263 RepID=A0AAD7FQR2_MYCRO|nr:hypothetical protein B0H17DRAFT_1217024 [Mycena rosella]